MRAIELFVNGVYAGTTMLYQRPEDAVAAASSRYPAGTKVTAAFKR